ncbi:MAG: hypothetical protein ACPL0C_02915 [Candidatus Bathyarchaeales archaeon]
MQLFKRETKIKVVKEEPKKEPAQEAQQPYYGNQLAQQQPTKNVETINMPAELQPLAEQWREAAFNNANAGTVNFTLLQQNGESRAYYILGRRLMQGGDELTLLRDDLTVWLCKRQVQTGLAGFVLQLSLTWQKVDNPPSIGVKAEDVIALIKTVLAGSVPAEYPIPFNERR